MYEPDSSSSSVVSSTSRSPQPPPAQSHIQSHHQVGNGNVQVSWTKPAYNVNINGNGGGGSPTITTNGSCNVDTTQTTLFMTHDPFNSNNGNGNEEDMFMDQQQQQSWSVGMSNDNGMEEGMDALKPLGDGVAKGTSGSSSMEKSASSDSNGGGSVVSHHFQETPTTTTDSGRNSGQSNGNSSNNVTASSSTPSSSSAAGSAQDQPEQSSNLSSTQNLSPTKTKPPKLCQVCGDKAKSFHFGGLSCDSCKAFFRRSVHNDAYKSFQCVYQHNCEINMSSRKSCQACRFKKCLGIGMETNWVMTEEERTQLQKQRNEKKESGLTTSGKPAANSGTGSSATATVAATGPSTSATPAEDEDFGFEPNVADMLNFMTAEERDEIESIVNKYQHSYREIPFRVSNNSNTRKTVEIIQMFTTILRRFAYFSKLIPEFAALEHGDQSTLLRAGVLEMCLLRSALAFDMKNNRWPKTENMEFLKDCPQLRVEDMEKLVSKDLYHMHMQFINGIQELRVDEPTVMILLLIVLFYPERGPLDQQEVIATVQEKYLLLLNKYVQWRFGPRASKVFPKLLTRLADLRQLNDFHTEYNLKMTKTEVEEIQEQLGNINLNPYPQWVLVDQQQKAAAAAAGGGLHSAHAYADLSGEQLASTLSTPTHAMPTPSPDYQDAYMQGPHQQHQQQHQQPAMMNFATTAQQMPYAGNAGAPRQFPTSSAAAAVGGIPQMPNMRQLFMQFVSQRIPTLITNPFATFPMENELSGAAAFFEQMSAAGGGAPSLQQIQSMMAGGGMGQQHSQMQDTHTASMGMATGGDQQQMYMSMPAGMSAPPVAHMQQQQQQHAHSAGCSDSQPQISQICNILESSDPDTLRQLKDSLSPDMVSKLSSIFGGGAGGSGGGEGSALTDILNSGSFDLSKIPPELIQSFLGGGGLPTTAPHVPAGIIDVDDGYQQAYAGPAGYSGHSGDGYMQQQQHHQHDIYHHHEQQLDLPGSNWGSGVGSSQQAQVVPEQQQHPILVGGGAGSGVDYTSAAFLTHRQQPQPNHLDRNPATDPSRYGTGNATHW